MEDAPMADHSWDWSGYRTLSSKLGRALETRFGISGSASAATPAASRNLVHLSRVTNQATARYGDLLDQAALFFAFTSTGGVVSLILRVTSSSDIVQMAGFGWSINGFDGSGLGCGTLPSFASKDGGRL